MEKTLNFTLQKPSMESLSEPELIYKGPTLSYPPVFAHIYLTKAGQHPDPARSKYDPKGIVYKRIDLIAKMKRPRKAMNLLSKKKASEELTTSQDSTSAEEELVPFWYPEINIGLVQSDHSIDISSLTLTMARTLSLTMDRRHYLPILYLYEGWRLKDRRILLDPDSGVSTTVPLKISFSPIGLFKLQLLTHFDHSFQVNEALLGNDGEMEKLKQMFIDTNPYLLIATLLVSVIHSVFDFLAFKNGISPKYGLKVFPHWHPSSFPSL